MSIYTLLKGWVFLYSGKNEYFYTTWKVEYFYTHKKIIKRLSWQTPPRDLYLNPVYVEIRPLSKSDPYINQKSRHKKGPANASPFQNGKFPAPECHITQFIK